MQTLKAIDIFDGVRSLLNDQEINVYNNDIIMPYYKIATEKLLQETEDSNLPITNATSAPYLITPAMIDIGGDTGPALPNDLIEVINCWELSQNNSNNYHMMRRVRFLPKTTTLTPFLEVYAWQNQQIKFLGAKGVVQVKLDYLASNLGTIVDENTIVKITGAVNFLKFSTAALCARFIGEEESRYESLMALSQDALDTMMSIKIKSAQGMNTRRRPFMASYKFRGYTTGR
jgi:hypothetical protein